MSRIAWISIGVGLLAAGTVLAHGGERGEEEGEEEHAEGVGREEEARRPRAATAARPVGEPTPATVAPTVDRTSALDTDARALYRAECGSCHVAYPVHLLPARSWDRLLAGLADHFGDNATLPPETTLRLAPWLRANAGDTLGYRSVSRIPADTTPLRITELSWFRGEHDEVPVGVVGAGAAVPSLAACGACHTGAADGRYGEGEIQLPGYGAWDD